MPRPCKVLRTTLLSQPTTVLWPGREAKAGRRSSNLDVVERGESEAAVLGSRGRRGASPHAGQLLGGVAPDLDGHGWPPCALVDWSVLLGSAERSKAAVDSSRLTAESGRPARPVSETPSGEGQYTGLRGAGLFSVLVESGEGEVGAVG